MRTLTLKVVNKTVTNAFNGTNFKVSNSGDTLSRGSMENTILIYIYIYIDT